MSYLSNRIKKRAITTVFFLAFLLALVNILSSISPSHNKSKKEKEESLAAPVIENVSSNDAHNPFDNYKRLHPLLKAALIRTSGGGGMILVVVLQLIILPAFLVGKLALYRHIQTMNANG